jgi:hypothetical protein
VATVLHRLFLVDQSLMQVAAVVGVLLPAQSAQAAQVVAAMAVFTPHL